MRERDERTGRRVVITGIGVVSSIGTGTAEFAEALRSGRSGASSITAFDTTGYDHDRACEVADFDPARWLRVVAPESLGRAAQLAAAAARMAVDDAGLDATALRAARAHVSIGTTDGEARDLDTLTEDEAAGVQEARAPELARHLQAVGLPAAVARELGLTDVEVCALATACSAGNYAIGNGADAIRFGDADLALCGGADAVCRKTYTAFYRLGTIAPDVCRPFDVGRKGILTGEGSAVLILEEREAAVARGARIYAEVLGYGLNCDANHPVAPDQDSVAACMGIALTDAGVAPDDVDLILAHGTGTKANDVTEVRAIHQIYPGGPPPTISIKSMLGHTMGAASAHSAAAAALAITHGFIPPTINHIETDPECAIDCVPNVSVPADLEVVQVNGLAFGGNNATLVLGRVS